MVRRSLLAIGLFLLAADLGAQVGTVTRTTTLAGGSFFGSSIAKLGDLNGDGTTDIAVGSSQANDGATQAGAILILFLASDGSELSRKKISQSAGGFTGPLGTNSFFGGRIVNVGDLDGDLVPELVTFAGNPNRLYVLFLKSDGTLKGQAEIQFTDPAFAPATTASAFDGEQFFGGLEALGDLDGDGLGDLAVGAPFDQDAGGPGTGAVWILRLSANGTLKAAHKISMIHGGFTGDVTGAQFGTNVTQLGDLDGDGNRELMVATAARGAFWVLYLDAGEIVTNQHSYGSPDYGVPTSNARWVAWLGDLDGDGAGEVALGYGQFAKATIGFLRPDGSVRKKLRNLPFNAYRYATLGDLDGDGSPELAVGDPSNNLVTIATLQPSAVRKGSINPVILSQTREPVFASPWTVTIDCSGHASGLAAIYGFSQTAANSFRSYGEVLVGGVELFHVIVPHTGGPTTIQVNMPLASTALIDLPVHVQGALTGAPHAQLSNALDVLLGQ